MKGGRRTQSGDVRRDQNRLAEEVEAYRSSYRVEGIEISDLYDLELDWPEQWPHAERQGVYAIYDANKTLRYIGKASMGSTLGARLSSYFVYGHDGQKFATKPEHNWSCKPRYVQCIAVAQAFEAPSLEEYLITRLDPSDNSLGRSDRK